MSQSKLFEEEVKDIITLSVLREWVLQVETRALKCVGIYRKSGTKSHIDKMVEMYDLAQPVDLSQYSNDDIACTLKQYIRTLKIPLIPFELYHLFCAISSLSSEDEKIEYMHRCLDQLPQLNYVILRYVMAHLCNVAQFQEENLMNPSNLSVVFGPVLFRKANSEATENALALLQDIPKLTACVKLMIEKYETLFYITPEEGHTLSEEDYVENWRDVVLGKIPFPTPKALVAEPSQDEEAQNNSYLEEEHNDKQNDRESNKNDRISNINEYNTNRNSNGFVAQDLSSNQQSNVNTLTQNQITNSSTILLDRDEVETSEFHISNSSLPPPPSIDIEEARQLAIQSETSASSPTTAEQYSKDIPSSYSSDAASSPQPDSKDRRFNILSQSPEKKIDEVSSTPKSPTEYDLGDGDSSFLLSPQHKGKAKRGYSLFGHMLTTNVTILSILYDQAVFPASTFSELTTKLLHIAITLGTTHHLFKALLEFEFDAKATAGAQSTGILRANSLLSKLLDELINVEGATYLRRMFLKQILLIIDTESAKITLTVKEGRTKKEKSQQLAVFERNKQKLIALVDIFIRSIISERTQKKMPDDMKFVCTMMKELATAHNLPATSILSGFVMLRMYNPVIVNPQSVNIFPTSGKPLTDDQKRILILVSRVLQKIGNDTRFSKTDVQMSCMNLEIERHIPSLAKCIERLGFTQPELQLFKQHRDAISAQNISRDILAYDPTCMKYLHSLYEQLCTCEEVVKSQADINKKLVLAHLLSIFPDGTHEPNPEIMQSLVEKTLEDEKPKEIGVEDLLLPSSDIPISLDKPLESLTSRIDDCRRKQGIFLIPDILTMTNLQLVMEKQLLKRELQLFDLEFEAATGREPQKEDKSPLRSIYQRYKQVRVVMTSKGLTYPREMYEKIASVSQLQLSESQDLNASNNQGNGKKRSKFSLTQLSNDERVIELLKNDPEYNRIRSYKREVQKLLHQYQDYFERRFGRKIRTKQDGEPLKQYYDIYKYLKYELISLCEAARREVYNKANK